MRKPIDAASRHLDTRTALDYLESRMDAADRRRVEAHLGSPCERCHGLVRELGWLTERMQHDRVPDIAPRALARAIGGFEPPAVSVGVPEAAIEMARLLFDSWTHPLPAGGHRSVGEMRRLRFALGTDVLELESEVESAGTRVLRGRMKAADPSLYRVEVQVGRERLSVRPHVRGSFAFDRVPLGPALITVSEPGNRYRLPALE